MAYPPKTGNQRWNSPLDAFDYTRLSTSDRALEDGAYSSNTATTSFRTSSQLRRRVLVMLAIFFVLHWFALLHSSTYAKYASLEAIVLRSGIGSDGSPSSWIGLDKFESSEDIHNVEKVSYDVSSPFDDMFANPEFNAINSSIKARAAFVVLARNRDLWDLVASIRQIEDRFNRDYHYPWVFLNNEPFTEDFKRHTSGIASGTCTYGLIPKNEWSQEPDWIDQDRAATARQKMVAQKIIYGGSQSYRRMCRYQSGFFWRHPLLNNFDYYWRVEPGVKYFCDIDYDPFVFMRDNKKKYGWAVSIFEYAETIPSLWQATQNFIHSNQDLIPLNNLIDWISDDRGLTYNRCHFWSNFEIGDLNFYRSEAYRKYFDHLDRAGGFFYERWGDAPVHSIAAALFLDRSEVHFFRDIGYRHEPFQHCPAGPKDRERCSCNPSDSFEFHWYSCTNKYKEIMGLKAPS